MEKLISNAYSKAKLKTNQAEAVYLWLTAVGKLLFNKQPG
jgi:hypothetical protein